MASKIAVVTGANKGIGFAIVKALCTKFDGVVYLTSRDVGRGEAAVTELKKEGLNPLYHQLDITDVASITRFHDYIKTTHGGIDVLVNNAGFAYKAAATEPMGIQAADTIHINYTGTLTACRILFPLLHPGARVVNVSSSCGHLFQINGDEPAAGHLRDKFASPSLTEDTLSELMNQFIQAAKDGNFKELGWPSSTYVVSKVGVSALTRIQQRAFDADPREDIIVNSVHPGYVDTDMSSHKGPLTIDQGAVAPLYLALLPPGSTEIRGGYMWYDKRIFDWVKPLQL